MIVGEKGVSLFEPDFFLLTAPQTSQTPDSFSTVPLNSIGVILYRVNSSLNHHDVLQSMMYIADINPASLNNNVL